MKTEHLSDVELALRPHRITGPVMAAFIDGAAIQPAAAMTYRPATPGAAQEFQRLIDSGVLRPEGGGHWFDLRRHYALRRTRELAWMVGLVAAALLGALIAVMFYRG